jgi:FkbM family methyltransferase
MPAKGFKRYIELFKHIQNPFEYILHKNERFKRSLTFITKPNNIQFHVALPLYQVFKEIFLEDVYNIEAVVKQMPPKPVIIDIGANAGFFDVLILSKIKHAKIFAYEPIPRNIHQIRTTLEANPSMKDHVVVHQVAVTGTASDKIDLYIESENDNSVIASIFADFNTSNANKISVDTITLTDILLKNDLTEVDILKVDCEGSEYDIFYNTDPAVIRRAKMILLEVHDLDEDKNNITAMSKFLIEIGYDVTHQPINNFCHAVEAVLKK